MAVIPSTPMEANAVFTASSLAGLMTTSSICMTTSLLSMMSDQSSNNRLRIGSIPGELRPDRFVGKNCTFRGFLEMVARFAVLRDIQAIFLVVDADAETDNDLD